MTKTTSGELSGYFIQTNEGGFEYGLSDSTSNGPYALTATTLVESLYNSLSWFHIAMTYDGSNTAAGLAFYLNGVLQTPSEQGGACITSTVGNNPLILVNDPDVYGAVTHMRTSNVSIWNIALSPTQVGDVYGNGHPPDLSLLSYFSSCNQWYYLGNGDNTTVFDHGSAGINLTKSSDVTYVNDRP